MDEVSRKYANTFFCLGYACLLLGFLIANTHFPVPDIFKSFFILLGTVFVIIKMLVFDKVVFNSKFIKLVIWISMLIVISIISTIKSSYSILTLDIIFILAANKVDFEKILKTFIITNSFMLIIMFGLSQLGIIHDRLIFRGNQIRHTFGYGWPTDLVSLISFIFMADLYITLKNKKNVMSHIFFYLIVDALLYFTTYARLNCVIIIFISILGIWFQFKPNGYLFFRKKEWVLKLAFFLCALISYIIVSSYMKNPFSPFFNALNDFTSNRLSIVYIGINSFGYTLFGDKIYSQDFLTNIHSSWFFVDSTYYSFFLIYGVILFILVGVSYYLVVKKMLTQNEYIIPIFLLVICIASLIEFHFYWINYNVFLLSVFARMKEAVSISS